jgi:hypothetical protein
MNLIGKIFTLLIFFMSICFLVISVMVGASHRNWKEIASKKNDEASIAVKRLQDAKNSTTEQQKLLSAERVSRAFQLAQLESQLKTANANFISKEAELRKVIEISQEQLAQLEKAEARLAQQDKEIVELTDKNNTLVDDISNQFALTRDLTNETFEQRNQIGLLSEKEADMTNQLVKMEKVLSANGLTANSNTDHIVPKLEGVVTRIGNDGLFAVSVGSDDGIKVGHEMDIYRNDKYIGKATVVNVLPDISALKSNKDYMRGTVQEGDYVTTKF